MSATLGVLLLLQNQILVVSRKTMLSLKKIKAVALKKGPIVLLSYYFIKGTLTSTFIWIPLLIHYFN